MTAQTMTPCSAAERPIPGKASGKSRSLWQEAMLRLVRNRAALTGGIIIILLILTALSADLIAPYSFEKQSLLNANAVPEWVTRVFPSLKAYTVINNDYPIGADKLGRDLFSRIVYGTRVSLAVAFIGPLISLILGVLYGSIAGFFYTEAFLSFFGLDVNPPIPSWGSMIADGSRALRAYPDQALFPAFALALTMFAFNFLGDGLRDALEPRLRGTQEK